LDKFERREKAIQGFSRRFSRRLESLSVVKLKLRESWKNVPIELVAIL
jgi:hypothetical protein